ncbi:MFS transporter [Streptomyces sp. NPDC014983]|uniref:MFS transporter n=1 Tax=Streptomyces sp. NPDC014983 TaxID=3364933 RepID=UPI0036FCA1C9
MATDAPLGPSPTLLTAPARSARSVVLVLLAGSLLLKAGGFAWDYLSYYVVTGTGHGTAAAGAALTVFGIGWCLGQAGSGLLTDRLGQRTALIVLMLLSAAACFALTLARSLPALLAVALLLGMTMEAHRPAVSAAINDAIDTGAGRTRAQAMLYWSANVGIAVCGGAGGYIAHHHGYRGLFLANGVVCLAFAVIARRTLSARPPAAERQAGTVTYRQVLADPALCWIGLAAVFAMICAWGLVSVLPLLMTSDGLPPTTYGTAMIANTVSVLLLTPPMMRFLVGRGEQLKYPLAPILAAGSAVLGLGITVAAVQHTTLGYSVAAAILVPGEICYSVAIGAFISTAAPVGATGRYQAVLSAAGAIASLPPLGIALALDAGGRVLVAVLLGFCALVAVLACRPLALALRSADRPVHAGVLSPVSKEAS